MTRNSPLPLPTLDVFWRVRGCDALMQYFLFDHGGHRMGGTGGSCPCLVRRLATTGLVTRVIHGEIHFPDQPRFNRTQHMLRYRDTLLDLEVTHEFHPLEKHGRTLYELPAFPHRKVSFCIQPHFALEKTDLFSFGSEENHVNLLAVLQRVLALKFKFVILRRYREFPAIPAFLICLQISGNN